MQHHLGAKLHAASSSAVTIAKMSAGTNVKVKMHVEREVRPIPLSLLVVVLLGLFGFFVSY